jgi:PilZ domain-containing protein/RDD family protein
MQAVPFPARQARTHYRHELRSLTYVTLDEANGGIIRNLNRDGVAVQAVAPLRQHERVRVRFELRYPRLRVEIYGQVSWASPSGQCGIRFVDLPARTGHQIDEWIFSNLLEAIARDAEHPRSIFGASVVSIARNENVRDRNVQEEDVAEEEDGLRLSPAPRAAIRLEPAFVARDEAVLQPRGEEDFASPEVDSFSHDPYTQPWLSRPLSGRTLAWLVDGLIVTAGLLLFALIFLFIANELPPWPLTLGTVSVAAVFVVAAYWGLFAVFGGSSLGTRLAQAAASVEEQEEVEDAVRIR